MLNEALRLIRVFHDLKQNELADKLEISKSYLSEIESGRKTPSTDLIESYAALFDLPVSSIWFFNERLRDGSDAGVLDRARGVVSEKVLNFLRMVEQKAQLSS